jgi:predicted dehydrogenase
MQDISHLKIGVIGLGHWGPNHVRVFSQLKNCKVLAVADLSADRLKAASELVPGLLCFSDHEQLLKVAELDAVVVVTPTKTHFSIVADALRAGKHVLCEKPLCLDPCDAETLVGLAHLANLVLMVGHVFLFNQGLIKVKELIDAGEMGLVRYLSANRTNLGPVRSDVNAAYDLAAHDVAIFNWIANGEPLEVRAMGAAFVQPSIEDVVVITLRYPGNILASIQCSWLDPKKVRQITFVGSKRMITWDDLALSNPVAIYEKSIETNKEVTSYGEFLRVSMLDGEVRLPKIQPDEPLKAQDREFLCAIRERREPRSNGNFSIGVVRVLKRIQGDLDR